MRIFLSTLLTSILSVVAIAQNVDSIQNVDLSEQSYLAEVAYYSADYNEAEKLFELLKEGYIKQKNYLKTIDSSVGLARTQIAQGRFSEATQECEDAISYIKLLDQVDSARIVVINRTFGEAYLNNGLNDLALERLKSAEDHLLKKNDLAHADLMEEIGVAYWNNGNQKLAREYHNRVLQTRSKLLSEDDEQMADSFINIGLVNITEEDYLGAMVFFKKALGIYEGNQDTNDLKIANVYSNMAFANFENGAYALAGQYFENVENIYSKVYPNDHPNKAFVEANLGRVEFQQENYNGALERFNNALRIYKSVFKDKHPEVADTYARIGEVYQFQDNPKKALEFYQKAIYANLSDQNYNTILDLPKLEKYLNAEYLLSALSAKAMILEDIHYNKSLKPKHINSALKIHVLSDSLISRIKQIRVSEADKIKTSALSKEIYKNGIRVSIDVSSKSLNKKYYNDLAYQFFERSKASTLHEAINDTKAKNFAGIPAEVLEKEENLITEIVRLENRLNEQNSDEEEEAISKNLFNKNAEYRQFIENLESQYPEYYSLKYQTKLASVEDIRKKLKDNEIILSYFLAEGNQNNDLSSIPETLYIMAISKKKVDFKTIDLESDFLNNIRGFRNAIKYKSEKSIKRVGSLLFNILMPLEYYDKYNFFTIIPDGSIGTIPFEALLDNNGDYVIEKAGINYDFSANLYYENIKSEKKSISKLLAIAPISFNSYDNLKLGSLPGTKREVESIQYNGKGVLDVNLWTNENASESGFKATTLQNFDIIHFATHGEVNESEPARSRIFLHKDKDKTEDGFLYSSEIYNIKLNADLVTLSACETGLGKVAKGEGIIGLSRSLKYAGGRNLIVSLWKVADQSTSDLMIDFYQKQQTNNFSYAMALRDAKLSLLYSTEYNSPYYWAPFILIGK